MLFVVAIYENKITSVLVVPSALRPYKTLKDVVNAGYKISYGKFFTGDNDNERLLTEFDKHNISNKFNQSLLYHNYSELNVYLTGLFYSQNPKQAYLDRSPDASVSSFMLDIIQGSVSYTHLTL